MLNLKNIKKQTFLIGKSIGILLYIIICSSAVSKKTSSQSTKEYQVKAAFIFNFTQFIEWPPNSFSIDKSPFVIGILGDDPFGQSLNNIVADENVNGHPIIIEHYSSIREIKNCHMLYVSAEHGEMQPSETNMLKEKSILTISDIPDFALKGGMIGFFLENNKVRFHINLDRAKKVKLSIDSRLLRLAQIVSDKGD